MVEFDSAFECGNGTLVSEPGALPLRVQTRGEGQGAGGYFCFELRAAESGPVTVEVVPDPASLPKRKRGTYLFDYDALVRNRTNPGGLVSPPVWVKQGEQEWTAAPADQCEWTATRLGLQLTVPAGEPLVVSSVPVLTPQEVSDTVRALGREQSHCATARSLGSSGAGHPLAGLYAADQDASPEGSFWIVAGARGVEFPGQWAALGAAEWLTGGDELARWARRRWNVIVVPQLNRDGAEAGNPLHNASGHDVFRSFTWAATGRRCDCPDCRKTRPHAEAVEAATLWQKVRNSNPGLYLEFRGARRYRSEGRPGEQWFHVPSQLYAKGKPREFHDALDARLLAALPVEGSDGFAEEPFHSLLHWTGGQFNVPAYLYQIHASRGPDGCKEFGALVVRTLLTEYRTLSG